MFAAFRKLPAYVLCLRPTKIPVPRAVSGFQRPVSAAESVARSSTRNPRNSQKYSPLTQRDVSGWFITTDNSLVRFHLRNSVKRSPAQRCLEKPWCGSTASLSGFQPTPLSNFGTELRRGSAMGLSTRVARSNGAARRFDRYSVTAPRLWADLDYSANEFQFIVPSPEGWQSGRMHRS